MSSLNVGSVDAGCSALSATESMDSGCSARSANESMDTGCSARSARFLAADGSAVVATEIVLPGARSTWQLFNSLVRTLDLFFEQGVECLHQIFWRTLFNSFSDFLAEVDGFELV